MAEVSEVRQLPAEFIEALGKTYADELTKTVGGLKQIDVSQLYGPQFVAGPGALTTQAESMAGGLGSYAPYLQGAAQAQQTAAGMVGPQAYQAYMSPYQQDVIQSTLQEYDIQAQKGIKGIAEQAIQAGAFGGGREGVQRAEYMSASDRNRAALQAQLLQQGFGQAQQARQQDIQTRFGLGQAQSGLAGQQLGLGQFQAGLAGQVPQLQRADISTLGQVGAAQQAQSQAELDAQRQGARTAAYEPLERLGFFGQGVTGLMGGYPAQYNFQSTPAASPLQTALGLGTGLAGIFGALK